LKARAVRIGKRGMVVIPIQLRRAYGLEEESVVLMEPAEGGILLRPASVLPTEVYTPQRKAQFLLNNAVTAQDYAWAVEQVRALGLDPETVPHEEPPQA